MVKPSHYIWAYEESNAHHGWLVSAADTKLLCCMNIALFGLLNFTLILTSSPCISH